MRKPIQTQRFYLADRNSNQSQFLADVSRSKNIWRLKRFFFFICLAALALYAPKYAFRASLGLGLLSLLFLYWDLESHVRISGAVICPACKTTIQIRMNISKSVSRAACPHCRELLEMTKVS